MAAGRRVLRASGIALLACSVALAAVALASCAMLVSRGGPRSITEISAGGVMVTWNPRRADSAWPWQGWRPVRSRRWTARLLWGWPRRGTGAFAGWPIVVVPLGPPVIVMGLAGGVFLLAAILPRRPAEGCAACGYDLAGLSKASVCPECGAAVTGA